MTERFQPGGVTHALVSGLVELALGAPAVAAILLYISYVVPAALGLVAHGRRWSAMGVALLRARVYAAELDDEAVTLHGRGGARRYRYDELSAVEVSGRRTRLVTRDGGARVVRGVRGPAQGNRFRARVLARARAAVSADTLPADRGEGSSDG